MTMSVGLGGLDEPLDLVSSQMLAGAQFGVRRPPWRDCSISVAGVTKRRFGLAMFCVPLEEQLFKE
jgi:hypothetical protein